MMDKSAKIFVAGHKGLVGSAITKHLQKLGYSNLITRTRGELDLTKQAAVENFFASEKPEYVFMAAAKVGGIYANSHYPAEFFYDNIAIQNRDIINKTDYLARTGTQIEYADGSDTPQ